LFHEKLLRLIRHYVIPYINVRVCVKENRKQEKIYTLSIVKYKRKNIIDVIPLYVIIISM